jgi:hypothetical protein
MLGGRRLPAQPLMVRQRLIIRRGGAMSGILTRRSLLAGAGYAAAFGTLAVRLLSVAEAQQAQPQSALNSLSMTMVFPQVKKAKIDEKRYVEEHLPLLRSVYGDSAERIEFRVGQPARSGMPPTSVLGTSHIWIRDVGGFSKALAANSAAINLNLDEIAKGPRLVQIDRLVATAGEDMSEVKVGNQVMTVFYPQQSGKTLDDKYFASTHIPTLYSLYGSNTARRLTGLVGVDQGGTRAHNQATVHVYIRDRVAYDSSARSVLNNLIDDAKKFTTIIPEFNELRVQAIV